jgi:hypothetical protein
MVLKQQSPFFSPSFFEKRGAAKPLGNWPREWLPLCEGFRLSILSNEFFPEYLNRNKVLLYYGIFQIRRILAQFRHFGGNLLAGQSLLALRAPPKCFLKRENRGDFLIPSPFPFNPPTK